MIRDEKKQLNPIQRVKDDVDDVTDLMRSNLRKAIDRGAQLEEIEDQSGMFFLKIRFLKCNFFLENLIEGAMAFRTGARNARRKLWWQNTQVGFLY